MAQRNWARVSFALLAAGQIVVSTKGASAQTAAAAPAAPTTLWNFLGIPQGVNKVNDNLLNRNGNAPGMERKPPLVGIANPANLQSANPAIKKAAEVKAAEDLAPQKVKALKYLARIGCGCYDIDGKVSEAFIAALDDCTEEVRFQAAIAILDANKNHCAKCNRNCCCSEDIAKKLSKLAYEMNDKCCYMEPSARVRMAAKDALAVCCKGGGFAPPADSGLEQLPAPGGDSDLESMPRPDSAELQPKPGVKAIRTSTAMVSRSADGNVGQMQAMAAPVRVPNGTKIMGSVAELDADARQITLKFSRPVDLRPGDHLEVYHEFLLTTSSLGEVEVVAIGPTSVTARPVSGCKFKKMSVGDGVWADDFSTPAEVAAVEQDLATASMVAADSGSADSMPTLAGPPQNGSAATDLPLPKLKAEQVPTGAAQNESPKSADPKQAVKPLPRQEGIVLTTSAQ